MRIAFLGIGLGVILFNLLPLETTPRRWAGPDLLLTLACVWTLRRPDYAPALAVGTLVFLADLMFQRPPGLMAALVVVGCEWLRARARTTREMNFLTEWAAAAAVMAGVLLGYRVALAIFLTPQPPLVLNLMQLVVSVAVYPLAAVFFGTFMGVRRISASHDELGRTA
ncbi:hypothetical protein ATO6_08195 [Oceanicola sp. 22II-s10i]|nr:hypothetical protein ATO6_08195 [Oceanicola sp. 22II-s10i]